MIYNIKEETEKIFIFGKKFANDNKKICRIILNYRKLMMEYLLKKDISKIKKSEKLK